jgi:TonB family protein
MQWANNSAENDSQSTIPRKAKKVISEDHSIHKLPPIQSVNQPARVHKNQAPERVVQESQSKKEAPVSSQSILASAPPQSTAPKFKTQHKLTEISTNKPLSKIEEKLQKLSEVNIQDHPLDVNEKDEPAIHKQQLSSHAEAENDTQIIRYEIGSNNNPKPNYPSLAIKRGWQGQVVLGVHVNPDGSIEHLTFVKSTDYGVLNFEAYETVRTSWHFKPLENSNSLSKPAYIEVPITFNIANR